MKYGRQRCPNCDYSEFKVEFKMPENSNLTGVFEVNIICVMCNEVFIDYTQDIE